MLASMLLCLALTMAPAHASPDGLAPTNGHQPTLIAWPEADAVYFPLAPGAALTYETPGPMRLQVEVRRRALVPDAPPAPVDLEVLGDGHPFLTIRAARGLQANTTVFDEAGGSVSQADRATLEVPAGGSEMRLRNTSASVSVFVRVLPADGAELPVAAPLPPPPEPEPEPDPPALVQQPEPVPTEPDAAEQTAREKPDPRDSQARTWTVGAVAGLGAPARGDRAVLYLGLSGRTPVVDDWLSVGAHLGWYRIGVATDLSLNDPYTGPQQVRTEWHTTVVPLTTEGLVHIPLDLGPVRPIAGAGMGLYFARRVDDAGKRGGPAFGTHVFAGAEAALPEGALSARLGWAGARRQFGNQGADGEPVREALGTTRIDLSYLYTF